MNIRRRSTDATPAPATPVPAPRPAPLGPVDKVRALVTSRAILTQLQDPRTLTALQTLVLLVLALVLLVAALTAL